MGVCGSLLIRAPIFKQVLHNCIENIQIVNQNEIKAIAGIGCATFPAAERRNHEIRFAKHVPQGKAGIVSGFIRQSRSIRRQVEYNADGYLYEGSLEPVLRRRMNLGSII